MGALPIGFWGKSIGTQKSAEIANLCSMGGLKSPSYGRVSKADILGFFATEVATKQ